MSKDFRGASNGGHDGGGLLISPDGVAPIQIVGVSACYLPLHHKVQTVTA